MWGYDVNMVFHVGLFEFDQMLGRNAYKHKTNTCDILLEFWNQQTCMS